MKISSKFISFGVGSIFLFGVLILSGKYFLEKIFAFNINFFSDNEMNSSDSNEISNKNGKDYEKIKKYLCDVKSKLCKLENELQYIQFKALEWSALDGKEKTIMFYKDNLKISQFLSLIYIKEDLINQLKKDLFTYMKNCFFETECKNIMKLQDNEYENSLQLSSIINDYTEDINFSDEKIKQILTEFLDCLILINTLNEKIQTSTKLISPEDTKDK